MTHGLRSMPGLRSHRLRWAGSLVSAAALAALGIVLLRADWREFAEPLAEANLEWLGAAACIALSVEIAKTMRWQALLGLGFRPRPGLLGMMFSARLLNAVAPLRAGDVWRVASVARGEKRPLAVAGGSVLGEKLLDGAALAGAAAAALLPAGTGEPWALLFAVVPVLGVALALGLSRYLGQRLALARWTAGTEHIRDPRVLVGVALLTVAGIGLGLLVNLAVLRALGLPDSLRAGVAMLVSGYAVGLVPAGPGQLGVFELAVAAPLVATGLSPAASLAAALTLHLVLLSMLGLGGLLAIPLGLLSRSRKSEEIDG